MVSRGKPQDQLQETASPCSTSAAVVMQTHPAPGSFGGFALSHPPQPDIEAAANQPAKSLVPFCLRLHEDLLLFLQAGFCWKEIILFMKKKHSSYILDVTF